MLGDTSVHLCVLLGAFMSVGHDASGNTADCCVCCFRIGIGGVTTLQVLIYVFDVESRELEKDFHYFQSCLSSIAEVPYPSLLFTCLFVLCITLFFFLGGGGCMLHASSFA